MNEEEESFSFPLPDRDDDDDDDDRATRKKKREWINWSTNRNCSVWMYWCRVAITMVTELKHGDEKEWKNIYVVLKYNLCVYAYWMERIPAEKIEELLFFSSILEKFVFN